MEASVHEKSVNNFEQVAVYLEDDELVSINTLLLALQGRKDSGRVSPEISRQLFQLQKSGVPSPFTLGSLEFVEMEETPAVVEAGLQIIISIALHSGTNRDYEKAIRETGLFVDDADAAYEIALSLFACEHILAHFYCYCPVAY